MTVRALWLCLAAWLAAGCAGGRMMTVNTPVADLRALPHTTALPSGANDSVQETQLLYGERVRVRKRQAGWALVEALDQPEFTHHHRWEGYPGWIRSGVLLPWRRNWVPTVVVTERWAQTWADPFHLNASPWKFAIGTQLQARDMGGVLWKVDLLDGSQVWMRASAARSLQDLRSLSEEAKRQAIVRSAEAFIGDPYYWGGRSPDAGEWGEWASQVTGVDCSGLTNLAYLTAGIEIPRDAHEQFLRAAKISAPKPGDLVFLSERDTPRHIVHVMLYAGDEALIEGPGTGFSVRRISFQDRLGRPLSQLPSETVVDGQTVFFGTYLR